MSSQVTTAFVQQYGANVFHLSQQQGSMLRAGARVERQKGKTAFYDRIGLVAAQLRTSRHGDTPQLDTPHSRRMVTLSDYEWADMIDSQDKVRMLIDPASDYAKAAANAFGRSMDNVMIAAALGTAYTGETGTGTQALQDTQKVAAHTSGTAANLNVFALRKAKLILDRNNVSKGLKRYCAINASGLESLLNETAVTSSDYNTVKALVQGEINTFLGFEFILTNELITQPNAFTFNTTTGLYQNGGTSTTTGKSMIAWAEGGILLSVGEEVVSRIGERADKGYSTQVYSKMSIGATRLEDEKVVEIICAQS
jgi:hypothetical protein